MIWAAIMKAQNETQEKNEFFRDISFLQICTTKNGISPNLKTIRLKFFVESATAFE